MNFVSVHVWLRFMCWQRSNSNYSGQEFPPDRSSQHCPYLCLPWNVILDLKAATDSKVQALWGDKWHKSLLQRLFFRRCDGRVFWVRFSTNKSRIIPFSANNPHCCCKLPCNSGSISGVGLFRLAETKDSPFDYVTLAWFVFCLQILTNGFSSAKFKVAFQLRSQCNFKMHRDCE